VDDEEANEGIVCLAVALPSSSGGELYGLSVTILKTRLDDYYRDMLVADLQSLASSIAHPLGSVSRAGHSPAARAAR
jgi:DNA-binding IclR family transcriptional regulator